MNLSELPIVFHAHALDRGRGRFGLGEGELSRLVRSALRAGRLSGVRPRFLKDARRQTSSYAWTEDESIVFAVAGGSDAWHVYTIMTGRQEEAS